ncbi:MAG TPA: long-chain fatty acid--CoA ligase [Egibacteraceae bacterium]|nr:long-chain fatty acid--CoA ligase [Egibacteraceae bacterium]
MVTATAAGEEPAEVGADENLTSVLWRTADATPGAGIVQRPAGDSWETLGWAELAGTVERVAAGLMAAGVEHGDRVALMSGTRLEWTVADLAILAAGGVTVPLYETSSAEQCAWILSDSGAKLAIAGTADQAKTLDTARGEASAVEEVLVIDDGGLDALSERGESRRGEVRARAASVKDSDLATIIYTSGTTGTPKGCMLTHRNFLWTARQSRIVLTKLLGETDSTLMFLPLAHVFARLVQFLCLEAGVTMSYARGIEHVAEDIQSSRPTFLFSVPRVLEKVFNGAQRKAQGAKRKVFNFAVAAANDWGDDGSPGLGLKLRHAIADKLVYTKIRHALGGELRYVVSGGAPLAPYLARFFSAAGITVLEGYGLTETTAPATVNTPDALRLGTVGRPLPGVEIAIADDGEILIAGDLIFSGYFRNAEATADALDDGKLRTGDLGELDPDGFLVITGRKKEIIVTAGGKNVPPALLEERLKANRLVSQAMVVGDNRPFIAALITLDPDELQAFASERGLTGTTDSLRESEAVRGEIANAIDKANAAVSRAESIRNWVILERDFNPEDGEVTPTLKLRRKQVVEHFSGEIEALYTR